MGVKLWPVIITSMVGGPDDGETRLVLGGRGPEPPTTLPSTAAGHYVRHPEPTDRWQWQFLWIERSDDDRDPE